MGKKTQEEKTYECPIKLTFALPCSKRNKKDNCDGGGGSRLLNCIDPGMRTSNFFSQSSQSLPGRSREAAPALTDPPAEAVAVAAIDEAWEAAEEAACGKLRGQ
jgi:hypothetical protein